MTEKEIDASFDLPFTRLPHPKYRKRGPIPAYEMIKFSINIHRGCFGGCSFCTISAHQGKFIASRSKASILKEVEAVTRMPGFKGYISDVGGPSANMYRMKGRDLSICEDCLRPSCIHPSVCSNLDTSHRDLTELYREIDTHPLVKASFVSSGIRYDLLVPEFNKQAPVEDLYEYTEEVLRKLLLQEPSLKDRLAHMQFVWDQPRVLEGYSKGIKQLYGHRYILTGNASEFLDPVFSSGVTVAVESAWRAQELVGRYLRGEDVDFDKEYRQYIMSGVDAFRAYVKSWYSGDLQKIFLTNTSADNIKKKICSVLAGYAWDDTNPFALYADRSLQSMAEMVSP